jgi:hypothetical protein
MREAEPMTRLHLHQIDRAVTQLRDARDELRAAGACRAAAAVARAVKSAEGARRHAAGKALRAGLQTDGRH